MQCTSKVFMVKPVRFGYNPQTAKNNSFINMNNQYDCQNMAFREFLSFTSLLKANKINVCLAEDTVYPYTPDSIFPNNWFSTHQDGTFVLYPMFAQNRRDERKEEFQKIIKNNFSVKKTLDLTHWENEGKFLEGTGSMVLDRINKIAYACKSPRTSEEVLKDFCEQMGYTYILFEAKDINGEDIYHTNVTMAICTDFCFLCPDSIVKGKEEILNSLKGTNKKIIELTYEQMDHFAGNILELKNTNGRKFLIMSATARRSFSSEQLRSLSKTHRILSPNLETIESVSGGSARCMLAELF
ncbi:MAG: arginine deiminase-related protein [Bacteroidales bacterium]